ncbi:MAG: TfpX/TfpZ family type IV pilin accessory protein [Xanthomonadales bacterium]|nr:TfpX/TfpZ family type IV pilin accessory protein [Xanthomonadales bacterium]
MSRWKAAGIHLAFSMLIVACAFNAMLLTIYPPQYFSAGGGNQLLLILLAVDVVIGPTLTLIVFKSGKPGLKFDLTFIALVQLAALLYGCLVIADARPVFLVHVGDRFHLVRANQIEPAQLINVRYAEFKTLSWTGPKLAVAVMPADVQRQEELMMSIVAGNDLNFFPETYEPYDQQYPRVLRNAFPVSDLIAKFPAHRETVEEVLSDARLEVQQARYVPLSLLPEFRTVIIDATNARVLDIVDLDPW